MGEELKLEARGLKGMAGVGRGGRGPLLGGRGQGQAEGPPGGGQRNRVGEETPVRGLKAGWDGELKGCPKAREGRLGARLLTHGLPVAMPRGCRALEARRWPGWIIFYGERAKGGLGPSE